MFDSNDDVTKEIDVGTIAVVECLTGYTRSGPETSKCQGDGTWSKLPTCSPPPTNCPMLTTADIPNSKSVSGKEVEPGYVAPGGTLKIKCAKKHKLIKSKDSSEVLGPWHSAQRCPRCTSQEEF